jgi:hypothetical protein
LSAPAEEDGATEDAWQPRRWEYLVLRLRHDRQRAEEIGGERVYRVDQDEAILNALGAQGFGR